MTRTKKILATAGIIAAMMIITAGAYMIADGIVIWSIFLERLNPDMRARFYKTGAKDAVAYGAAAFVFGILLWKVSRRRGK